jgi:TonB family protein
MAETDGGAFVYDYYLQTVAEMISRAWEPPAGLTERAGETSAVIRFRILANGRVTVADVETASALDVFDRSARAAILRAQPFPPLPATYGGRWLMIHLKFAYGASQS